MALSIKGYPEGYMLYPTAAPGEAYEFGGNYQVRSDVVHGLSAGSIVYVKSDVAEYNGFFRVGATNAVEFEVRTVGSDENIPYIRDTDNLVFYIYISSHPWSCVHTPITYQLLSSLWPVNTVDAVRTISSVTNSNGYCNIATSGDIKATGSAAVYEYVKISDASDELDGVYQIVSYTSDSSFVINLAYSSAVDTALTNADIQYYYNNYIAKIRLYAGIPEWHEWYDQRPIELFDEFEVIPDENGMVDFSVSESLKKQITTRNNTLLATLPNNIDFWTSFYIEYAESYDVSSGGVLTRYTGEYFSLEFFLGYAVNAKLPFKNIHSGNMSEYHMSNEYAKFLTLFETPVAFSGQYFDISYLRPGNLNDVGFNLMTLYPFTGWTNSGVGGTTAWTISATPSVTLAAGATSDTLHETGITGLPAGSYTITINATTNSATSSLIIRFRTGGVNVTTPANIEVQLQSGLHRDSRQIILSQPIDEVEVIATDAGAGTTITLSSINVRLPEYELIDDKVQKKWYSNDVLMLTETTTLEAYWEGIYRLPIVANCDYDRVDVRLLNNSNAPISVLQSIDINCDCFQQSISLTWLNYLGGFEHWTFAAEKKYENDILSTTTTKGQGSLLPTWPSSYGEFADTIEKQITRVSKTVIFVRSQLLTIDQLQAISYIKKSILVQVINDIYDRRTVIVDSDSWVEYDEGDKQYTIAFKISYTDDIPVQSV